MGGIPAPLGLKGVTVSRRVCAELLPSSRVKEHNDRIDNGSFPLYSPWVGRDAQSGAHSGIFLGSNDAQSVPLRTCRIINFVHIKRLTRRRDVHNDINDGEVNDAQSVIPSSSPSFLAA